MRVAGENAGDRQDCERSQIALFGRQPGDDADLSCLVRILVDANKQRLFPGIASEVAIVDIALGPAVHFQETRFGRWAEWRSMKRHEYAAHTVDGGGSGKRHRWESDG